MEIRTDYTDDQNYTHVDYWETEDDNAEGRTIAIVCRDTKKVYFIDNGFRTDYWVKNAIEDVLSEL